MSNFLNQTRKWLMRPHFTFLSSECFCRLEYISHIYSPLNPLVTKVLALRRTCFVAPFLYMMIIQGGLLSLCWPYTKYHVNMTTVQKQTIEIVPSFIHIQSKSENITHKKQLNESTNSTSGIPPMWSNLYINILTF